MALRFWYWLIAAIISLAFAATEMQSVLTTVNTSFSYSSSRKQLDDPSSLYIEIHCSSYSLSDTIEGLTIRSAGRIESLIRCGVIGLFASLHLLAFYFIWLIAFKKRKHDL